jgi:Domain of unknown function (DUF4928)
MSRDAFSLDSDSRQSEYTLTDRFMATIAGTSYSQCSDEEWEQIISDLRSKHSKRGLRDFFKHERIKFDYSPNRPIRSVIVDILNAAKVRGQDGYVAQHLVGAKLAIRFRHLPNIEVSNYPGSASDDQAGRAGDFEIGDAAFHVTVAPSEATIRRCQQNVANGLASVLIVPDAKLAMARGLAEQAGLLSDISVEALESFVGQNISELGAFDRDGLKREFALLLQVYNERVEAVESDKSLKIEVPGPLQ